MTKLNVYLADGHEDIGDLFLGDLDVLDLDVNFILVNVRPIFHEKINKMNTKSIIFTKFSSKSIRKHDFRILGFRVFFRGQ